MRKAKVFGLLILYLCLIRSNKSENVQIPGIGTIIGSTGDTIWTGQKMFEFLSIPYAKSPSWNLRFKVNSCYPQTFGFCFQNNFYLAP